MSSPNIFADDWRACLHAHYLHVLHERDTSNETSLRLVLEQVGFDDSTLDGIRAEILAEPLAATSEEPASAAPLRMVSAADEPSPALDIAAELVIDEAVSSEEMPSAEEPPEPPPDADVRPTQLSLF